MVNSFFKKEEKKKKVKKSLCEKCKLQNKSPKLYFNEKSDILVIIDYYKQDISFVKSKLNIPYTLTFALQCENRNNITDNQINCCRENLQKVIQEIKPKKIITFGLYALKSLIGHKASVTDNIQKWLGWKIPDQEYQCFIYPNLYLDNDENIVLTKRFNTYLYAAIDDTRKFKKIEPIVNICKNDDETIYNLKNLLACKKEDIAIDLENTGLKPHRKGHKIYTMSITQRNLYTFSFKFTEKIKPYIKEILENENIGKIIQNLNYEKLWFNFFGFKINNIIFDTQLASHILDSRKYITGLKFQTYINFGLIGYEYKIKKFIESKEKGGNEFNSIEEADINDILLYNGYDTYFTMLLYKKQKRLLNDHLQKGFKLFMDGAQELSSLSGINFDKNLCDKYKQELQEQIDILHNKIMNSKEVNLLENKEEFNYNSDKQLRELIFDKCKWKSKLKTATGKKSVNVTALTALNRKLTNDILCRRKLTKIKDTYLSQFQREYVEIGKEFLIYPFFSLNNVTSFRSASQMINAQNIPSRGEPAKKYTRTLIIPRKGRRLLEIDFRAMEVGTSCGYHHDPVMIDYVANNGDMHEDLAKQLFFRNKSLGKERYIAKNGFVFPAFYGSTARMWKNEDKKIGAGDITRNIWEMLEKETKEHLRNQGIIDLQTFQIHVAKIEEDFWGRRFKIYKQWKIDNWNFYKENGYVILKTGFICNSIMGFNQTSNFPIQGSAFHILLYTLIKVNRFLRENKFKTVIIGQIHDSLILDVVPEELDYLLKVIQDKILEVKKEWTWINVPLRIETEITNINESWYYKKKLKFK